MSWIGPFRRCRWTDGRSAQLLVFGCLGFLSLPAAAATAQQLTENTAVQVDPTGTTPLGERVKEHPWERYVRGFRREHNFALALGASRGFWLVQRFGDQTNEHVDAAGVWTTFQYSYHLQISRGFGYLLGSSIGYHYESPSRDSAFRSVPSVHYPGVLAGLVLNANSVLRLSLALDVYLERFNKITQRQLNRNENQINVTLQAYDLGLFVDLFYELNWAVRLEAHRRLLYFRRPAKQNGDPDFPVDATFHKEDRWLGLALVFHLL